MTSYMAVPQVTVTREILAGTSRHPAILLTHIQQQPDYSNSHLGILLTDIQQKPDNINSSNKSICSSSNHPTIPLTDNQQEWDIRNKSIYEATPIS